MRSLEGDSVEPVPTEAVGPGVTLVVGATVGSTVEESVVQLPPHATENSSSDTTSRLVPPVGQTRADPVEREGHKRDRYNAGTQVRRGR